MFITRLIHHKDHSISLFQEVLRQVFHFQFWTFQIPGDEFVDTILQHFGHLPTSMGDGCHISKVQILQHRAFACTNEAKDQDFVGTIPQMNQICSRFKTFKTTQQFTKKDPHDSGLKPLLLLRFFQTYLTCYAYNQRSSVHTSPWMVSIIFQLIQNTNRLSPPWWLKNPFWIISAGQTVRAQQLCGRLRPQVITTRVPLRRLNMHKWLLDC